MDISNSSLKEMRKLVVSIVMDQEVFCDDTEFETVFGSTHLEYIKLLTDYMSANQIPESDEEYMLQNAIVNIAGYPHKKRDYIKQQYALDLNQIGYEELMQRCGYAV